MNKSRKTIARPNHFIDIQYHMDFTTRNTTHKHHICTHNEQNACTPINGNVY
jgi:hypothetical protein